MKVIGNRILVKKDIENEMQGSIWVPRKEGEYAPPYVGTIVFVGKDVTDSDFIEGSRVMFHDLAGTELFIENEKYVLLKDIEITGVVNEKSLNIV